MMENTIQHWFCSGEDSYGAAGLSRSAEGSTEVVLLSRTSPRRQLSRSVHGCSVSGGTASPRGGHEPCSSSALPLQRVSCGGLVRGASASEQKAGVSQRELVLAAFPSYPDSSQGVSCCCQATKQTINNLAKEESFQGNVPRQPE